MKKFNSLLVIFLLAQMISFGNYWTQKASLPAFERSSAFSFSIGKKGYIGGGLGNSGYLTDFWEYDKIMNTWTQLSSPLSARGEATAFSAQGFGYAGLGVNSSTSLYDFYKFDPATNSWTQIITPLNGLIGTTSISADSVAFVYGGYTLSSQGFPIFHNDFWKFDPVTGIWTSLPTLPGVWRGMGVGFGIQNKCLIATGYLANASTIQELWQYDIINSSWVQKANFPGQARYGASGFVIDSLCYMGTGKFNANYYYNCYKYFESSNQWSSIADFGGIERFAAVGFSIEGSGYIGFGSGPANYFNDLWEYNIVSTSLADVTEDRGDVLKIYPTPASDYAEFQIPPSSQKLKLLIVDELGRITKPFIIKSDEIYRIQCSYLAAGLYQVLLTETDNIIATGKFVVKK